MSGPEFLMAKRAWEFATKQPAANQIGPLGKRAGLDITELYSNVVRFEMFPDAKIWINIGQGLESDYFTQESLDGDRKVTIDYKSLDLSKMDVEFYIYERPFFNVPYLFVTVVIDGPGLSYIRPDGLYYQHLMERDGAVSASGETILHPSYFVDSEIDSKEAIGLPLYGLNHHNRKKHGFTGGACPQRGGDWGYYPFENSGSAWPTNLEEISPLCDGIIMDIKLWTNLNGVSWADSAYMLGNTAMDSLEVDYTVEDNVVGIYTDPYLIGSGEVNPYILDFTEDGQIVKKGSVMTSTIITVQYSEVASPPCYVDDTTTSPCFEDAFDYVIGDTTSQTSTDDSFDSENLDEDTISREEFDALKQTVEQLQASMGTIEADNNDIMDGMSDMANCMSGISDRFGDDSTTEKWMSLGFLLENPMYNKCSLSTDDRSFKLAFTNVYNCLNRCELDATCAYATTEGSQFCIGCKVLNTHSDGWSAYQLHSHN